MTDQDIRNAYFTYVKLVRGSDDYGSHRIARWDGGRDSSGRLYRPVWPRIRKFLESKKCDDVNGFIYANVVQLGTECYPTKFYNEAAWRRYEQYKLTIANHVKSSYRSNLLRFNALFDVLTKRMSREDAIRCIVTDPTNGLCPLFKFLIARKFGLSPLEIPDSVYQDARLQFLRAQKAYLEFWPLEEVDVREYLLC